VAALQPKTAANTRAFTLALTLAARDPANTQWQTDLVVSCANLGMLDTELTASKRGDYLLRGRGILCELKSQGRLLPNQDWTDWFDSQLAELPTSDS
jgi:hypothetical protein